jgi:4-amino-4-deoxy-L-arabinose transferase-like glycosyltransferase
MMVDVMLVDAAQYAEMSWQMLSSGSYLKLYNLNAAYLDKPPLLFWLNTVSFALLGISNFTYKLPSVLFVLLAIFSTYRFARLYYNVTTAAMAAVILATSQAVFLITNDVRTDTILMGAVIFAIWQAAAYLEKNNTYHALLAGLGVGLAMLAKGPIGFIATGAPLFLYVWVRKKWNYVFNWRIILPLLAIALLLLPMCIGLYEQWGTYGLRFYFWTQSFGRITGENKWNNNPDPIFLIHTTAWAFLPWTIFLFSGWLGTLYNWIRNGIKQAESGELICVSGFTLVLFMLMRSKYQLPHYIFVVYPLAAVIAAKNFIAFTKWQKRKTLVTSLQTLLLFALIIVSCLLQYAFKGTEIISMLCLIILYPLSIVFAFMLGEPLSFTERIGQRVYQFINKAFGITLSFKQLTGIALNITGRNIFWLSALVILVFNFLLGAFYFPAILKYQCRNDFGRYIHEHAQKEKRQFVMHNIPTDFAVVFYAQQISDTTVWGKEEFENLYKAQKNMLAITTDYGIEEIRQAGIPFRIIQQGYDYKIARMSLPFLNPKTRNAMCQKLYLVETN